jgi:Tol biopolymer transport system component
LILTTLNGKPDRVIYAGSSQGWPAPTMQPPAWSPDGRRVAFTRASGEQQGSFGYAYRRNDIFVVNAGGSGLRQVTQTGDASGPVWSPDAHEIVLARIHGYVSVAHGTVGLTASLWTIHPDGTGLRQLTATVDGQGDLPGSFSPDGRWLAFTRTEPVPATGLTPNSSSVCLLDLEHGTVRKLASRASWPAFSPNGRWIALSSTRAHNGTYRTGEDETAYADDLYLVDLSDKGWRRLTRARGIAEANPSFSPDGAIVAIGGWSGTPSIPKGLLLPTPGSTETITSLAGGQVTLTGQVPPDMAPCEPSQETLHLDVVMVRSLTSGRWLVAQLDTSSRAVNVSSQTTPYHGLAAW